MTASLLNKTLGGYRILARINEGGFGVVYRAKAKNIKHPVAIKVMKASLCKDTAAIAAFQKEFDIASQFIHKNIICYMDFGEQRGIPYLVMEYFEGLAIKMLLVTDKQDSVLRNINKIFCEIASAIGYLHEEGVVHRDIKPENVLVNDKGQVKLIDFSTIIKPGFLTNLNPFTRKAMGTRSYIAPEQLQKKKPAPSADIYAMGAMFYEILAGRPPLQGKDENETLNMVLKTDPAPITKFRKDIAPGFSRLLANMLAKNPADRPHSAKTILHRIKKDGIFLEY